MASLLPNAKQQFIDGNGVPLAGGTVTFYIPNSDTLKNTWQDQYQTILNTNPIILDAAGEAIIYGDGQYRQVVKDSLGNLIWDQLTTAPESSVQNIDPGIANFVIPPLNAPTVIDNGGLTGYTLPAGQAVLNGIIIDIPSVNLTVGPNLIVDYYLNPVGSDTPWTIEQVPAAQYTLAVRHPELIHVWSIASDSTDITAIVMCSRLEPYALETIDAARTVDQIPFYYVIKNKDLDWSSGASVSDGQIILNTTNAPGNMYQVITGGYGNLGTVAPTSTAKGTIINGTAQIAYYGQFCYVGNFRYSALSGGIFTYFANIACGLFSDLEDSTGLFIAPTYVKPCFRNQFQNLLVPRVNSGTYIFGQKVVAGNYTWFCTNIAGGTAGATTTPFNGTHAPGDLVVDGGITWKCIMQSYGSPKQAWFWYDTDRTMTVYNATNAGDSNPTTFFAAIWLYIQATNDWTWLMGNSSIPSGSGTYYTYLQCLQNMYDYNMLVAPNGFTQTFQQDINPVDGSYFPIQYTEDNCESYSGWVAALNIFFMLLDNSRSNSAYLNSVACAGTINSLYNTTYGVFGWYYGDDFSWVNNPANQWYPYYQVQNFPELHGVPLAQARFQAARQYVMSHWNNWPQDPGVTVSIPNMLGGYIAARFWQDTAKAVDIINQVETIFLEAGFTAHLGKQLLISDYAYYLQTKKILANQNKIKSINGSVVTLLTPANEVTRLNGIRAEDGIYPFIITYLDEVVVINNTTGQPVIGQLYMPTPTNGKRITIIDGGGNAATNNFTFSAYSGLINGSANFVMNTNYQQVTFTYSTTNSKWYAK